MAKKEKKKQSVKSSTKNSSSAKKPAAKGSQGLASKVANSVKNLLKAKVSGKEKVSGAKPTESKNSKSSSSVKSAKEATAIKITEKTKKAGAAVPAPKSNKKAAPKKVQKEDVELEDSFIETDGEGDEIGEYEEELKAVETLDEETDEDLNWGTETKDAADDEIFLTDAEGNRYCRARDCDQIASVDGYCRYHYLLFWKRIQVRKKILADGKLERYVEELTSRYPDKFLEMIRRDLRTQKDFFSAIQELEIDESSLDNEYEEDTQSFIDEVRGMNESPSMDEEEF